MKTDRIAAAYGRCNVHWYWPGGASIHLYLIMLPWAHSSPDPKRHLDRFSHFCTAHRRVCLYLYFIMAAPPSQNRPFSWGIWTPSNTWFPGPTQVLNPNGISIGSAVFAQVTAGCPYTLQWVPLSPSKLPLPMGDLDPHLTHGSLGPPKSLTQTASRSVQPFLQGSLA